MHKEIEPFIASKSQHHHLIMYTKGSMVKIKQNALHFISYVNITT